MPRLSSPRHRYGTMMRSLLLFTCAFISEAAFAQLPAPARAAGGGPGGRGTPIQAGEACPPGSTEIRPRLCMAPESPVPSMVDYRPRSTLVVPAHPVKTAKYAAIDFHG